jgi:hypothetical protein
MYDLLLEMSHTVWKNGLTLSALGTALYVLLKQRKVKKRLRKFVPWILDDDNEIKEYVQNQKRIEQKVDALLQERGIVYCAKESGTKAYPTSGKTSFTLPWVEKYSAHIVKRFINFNTKRGMRRMNKFRSRKFVLAVVAAILVVLNDGLELGVDSNTVMSFAAIVVGYIFAEAHVDGKKVNPVEEHSFDSERIDN